jgi:tetratricopeptide (TPR) repeat protein
MSASVEAAGTDFTGRFLLERPAGAGGMGAVYRARDRETGAPVAVKLLAGRAASEITRFLREAEVLSQIDDPAVVRYVAHGSEPQPYLVMEWLDGCDLAERLAREPPAIAESVALLRRVAGGLASVHAKGIVHRDLKPSNLFLPGGRLDQVKIIDFGIARASHARGTLTAASVVIGTPEYMAPEQARESRGVDARADVFSLGCVLFECLTGRPPFAGPHPMAVLARLLFEEAPRVSELREGVPDALADLVDRMLCKDPGGRPGDAAELAAELDRLARPESRAQARAPRPAASLTGTEDRLISMLVVGAGDPESGDHGDDRASGDTLHLGPDKGVREAVAELALRYGGRMSWLVDGTLVVVFSEGGVATDEASRAARCALEVRALVPEHPLSLVMGQRREGRPSPIGELIERAAGLLQGPRGGVRVDTLTAGLLDGRFEVEPRGEGLSLLGERGLAGTARKVLGKVVPFVGRERELAMLRGFLEEAEAGARAVLITGEPGVGKSRLRHELLQWARGRGEPLAIWTASGDPMRAAAPLGMLGDLLRHAAQIQIGEPLAARREKLMELAARSSPPDRAARIAEFLGEIVGTRFTAEHGHAASGRAAPPAPDRVELHAARRDKLLMADQMRRAWVDFLAAECESQPVLLVLEDLQWGDRATVEYVDLSLRLLKRLPLFVLSLARPEVTELFPDLWRARGVNEIRLSGLSRKACERLSRQLLGEAGTREVAGRLWERSGGNPFLMEELVRARAAGRVDDAPETALAMVQSRLSSLDAEARRLLRAASVLGQAFWPGGLRELLGAGTAEIEARLRELEEREWISSQPETKIAGEREYGFLHEVMREAAYSMLTEEDRRLGHALSGDWLERHGETDPLVLAQHFERGGARERAVIGYRDAAELALKGNDLAGAILRAERAIALGASGEALGELSLICAQARRWRGENAEAERWAVAAVDALPAGGERWCSAVEVLGFTALQLGRHDRLMALADALDARWSEGEAARPVVAAMAEIARRLLSVGARDRCLSLLARAEAASDRFGDDPGILGAVWAARGQVALFAGDPAGGAERAAAALACFERAGNLRMACQERINLASLQNELGAYSEAAGHLRRALSDAEQMGIAQILRSARVNLGRSLTCLGALDEACAVLEAAIEVSLAQGSRRSEGVAHLYLARALLQAGRAEHAESEARRARDLLSISPPFEPYTDAVLAQVLLSLGRPEEAAESARRAFGRLEALPTVEEGESLVRLVHAKALAATGDAAGAALALRAAHARLLERAEGISSPEGREAFLGRVTENARTVELFRAWAL